MTIDFYDFLWKKEFQFSDTMATIEQFCGLSCLSPVLPASVTHKPIIVIYTIDNVSQGTLGAFQGFEI